MFQRGRCLIAIQSDILSVRGFYCVIETTKNVSFRIFTYRCYPSYIQIALKLDRSLSLNQKQNKGNAVLKSEHSPLERHEACETFSRMKYPFVYFSADLFTHSIRFRLFRMVCGDGLHKLYRNRFKLILYFVHRCFISLHIPCVPYSAYYQA